MYCLLTLAPKCHNSAYPKLIDVSSPLCLAHLSLALTKKTSSTRHRAKQLTKWRWICWVESNNLLICSSSISPAPSREYYDFYPVSFPSGVCNLICIFTLPTPSPSPSLSPLLSHPLSHAAEMEVTSLQPWPPIGRRVIDSYGVLCEADEEIEWRSLLTSKVICPFAGGATIHTNFRIFVLPPLPHSWSTLFGARYWKQIDLSRKLKLTF